MFFSHNFYHFNFLVFKCKIIVFNFILFMSWLLVYKDLILLVLFFLIISYNNYFVWQSAIIFFLMLTFKWNDLSCPFRRGAEDFFLLYSSRFLASVFFFSPKWLKVISAVCFLTCFLPFLTFNWLFFFICPFSLLHLNSPFNSLSSGRAMSCRGDLF